MKKRFVIEYANYILSKYENGDIALLQKVTRTVYNCEYGYITVSETMKELANIERELELS